MSLKGLDIQEFTRDQMLEAGYRKLATKYPLMHTNNYNEYNVIKLARQVYAYLTSNSIYSRHFFNYSQGRYRRDYVTTNFSKLICEDLARLSFSEEICVRVDSRKQFGKDGISNRLDEEKVKELQKWIDFHIKETGIFKQHSKYFESNFYACGGVLTVPDIVDGEYIFENYNYDLIFPISWDKDIEEVACAKIVKKQGYHYLVIVEYKYKVNKVSPEEKLVGGVDSVDYTKYEITYEAYKGSDKITTSFDKKVDITEVYPHLEDKELLGSSTLPFIHATNAKANNMFTNSIMGVPVIANSFKSLKSLNEAFDVLYTEFKNGRKKLFVPDNLLKHVVDDEGEELQTFDDTDSVYQVYKSVDGNEQKLEDQTGVIRSQEIVQGIEGIMNIIALEIGNSMGNYTLTNNANVAITATEVKSKKGRTFDHKMSQEIKISDYYNRLFKRMLDMAKDDKEMYAPDVDLKDFDFKVMFGDSFFTDDVSKRNEAREEVRLGVKSKEAYLKEDRKLDSIEVKEEQDILDKEKQEDLDMALGGMVSEIDREIDNKPEKSEEEKVDNRLKTKPQGANVNGK